MQRIPNYLVIGHVTKDVVTNDSFRIGGTATYSALVADRLGLRTGVLTRAEPTISLFEDAPAITVVCRPGRCTTTFENLYSNGLRKQYVRRLAKGLSIDDVPQGWDSVPIVHLGPVAQEVEPDLAHLFSHSFLGVTPQGWLRRWDAQGLVSTAEWESADRILDVADATVLSPEDVGCDKNRLELLIQQARLLVVTLGQDGAIVHSKGRAQHVPAYAVSEVDPTGAGDVFAAAYFTRFFETKDIIEAARFANCVASFVVEAEGSAGVPSREQVEHRLRYGRLKD